MVTKHRRTLECEEHAPEKLTRDRTDKTDHADLLFAQIEKIRVIRFIRVIRGRELLSECSLRPGICRDYSDLFFL